MFTKTSLSAIRALMHVAEGDPSRSYAPRVIATALNESPSYMAKVTGLLVKAGILRAERGVKGGVRLNRPAGEVTLLAVVEACQGAILADYCQPDCDLNLTCNYHRAAAELHDAMVGVLSRWSLADLLRRRTPVEPCHGMTACIMSNGLDAAVEVKPPRAGREAG